VVTNPGDLMIINAQTGKIEYQKSLGVHEWSSPSIVNDTLILGLCSKGSIRSYDLSKNPIDPKLLWEKKVGEAGGCVESTPALYNGTITVGSRDGFLYHFK
jgi:outer membrane protein assembly factor BamB